MSAKAASDRVRGDRIWRTLALLVLCGLVYFFSYDHGRQSVLPRLEAERSSYLVQLAEQNREITLLKEALASSPGPESSPLPELETFSLKPGSTVFLFDNRVVLTFVGPGPESNTADLRLNFLEEESVLQQALEAGGNLNFSFSGRRWSLVAASIKLSAADLTLVNLGPVDSGPPPPEKGSS